jgi:dihydrosphingosine 1-phosphate phosphatase
MVHILAEGVFFTGWIKDFCSLPRPLSPPLHRITMSGSAALEYGFPSTHSANAVSVAVYGILMLHSPDNSLPAGTKLFLEGLSYFYALSIIIGRLYCGMHGFVDVFLGSTIGAIISLVEFYYGPALDAFMHGSSWVAPAIAALIIIVLVRIHPEPADDCPCFDDSVAFAGVVIGLEIATWTYGRLPYDVFGKNAHAVEFFDVSVLGWPMVMARIVFGVLIVFAWREIMKPAMLRGLPYLFRLIERAGLSLPRRFFKPASQYKFVPENAKIDTLIPSVSDIARVGEGIRHPKTRGRSISIGPQSAADAYETLAYRERKRRESVGSNSSLKSKSSLFDLKEREGADQDLTQAQASGAQQSLLSEYENMMGQGSVAMLPGSDGTVDIIVGQQDELEEKEMFSRLIKPRVRYDVEVVTKLVVYTGTFLRSSFLPLHRIKLTAIKESHGLPQDSSQ